jgi:hypothetical protein
MDPLSTFDRTLTLHSDVLTHAAPGPPGTHYRNPGTYLLFLPRRTPSFPYRKQSFPSAKVPVVNLTQPPNLVIVDKYPRLRGDPGGLFPSQLL